MSYNYEKSDNTLKIQFIRMQLETIVFCRIKRGISDRSIINRFSTIWLKCCKAYEIIPENNFEDEFKQFETESLLNFAPENTYINMEEKAKITLTKLGFNIAELPL